MSDLFGQWECEPFQRLLIIEKYMVKDVSSLNIIKQFEIV